MAKNILALLLLSICSMPSWVWGQDLSVFDQFVDAFNVGLFQGAVLHNEVILESSNDVNSTQGINIIIGYSFDGRVVQKAVIEDDVSLTMSDGDGVVQGINIFRGTADEISQIAIIDGTVTMRSQNNNGGIQGINVITSCESCY
jgi:hypothetical protein